MNLGQNKLKAEGDLVYSALMQAHDGLTEAESHKLNARLVLMLSNEVGNSDTLLQIFDAARHYSTA